MSDDLAATPANADERAVDGIRSLVADAVARLSEAGARQEELATFIPRQLRMLIAREPVLQPVGRVWRLGVLLLDADGVLRATGAITRATEPGRPAYQSQSAETRRAYRAAAQRGHFASGATVNYDTEVIDLDAEGLRSTAGPLFLRNGRALVRWSPTATDADAVDFARYLAERVELLVSPPQGA
ncbi:hypothetical protein GCM10009617_12500 [Leifsonia poae]|uniref:Glutaminase n=2 Tax=Leifsonia poae TaxID=110933 RepID=A0A9W6HBT3_9MICO|nr:hypothetical protein GCM10017584_24720 [Leifsonia poae]